MGHLKDLRKKQADGSITDEEVELLKGLESDIASEKEEVADEKSVDELADRLVKGIQEGMKDIMPAQEKSEVVVTKSPRLIVDPEMGEVAVEKLDEVKVEVPGRKAAGKQHTSVSKKTIHILEAMFTGDKEKLQVLVEGTGARGGFLVPEDFVNIVVEDRRDMTVMRQLATVLPVSTDTIHIPNLASRPRAFWRSEGAVKSTTTVDFGETVLTPYSLAAIVSLSNELVADARLGGNIVSLVARYMAQSLAEEEDKAFWTGNGSGRPTGIDNYSFTTINGGLTDATRADAIVSGLYRLPQGYRANAVFVANRNTMARISQLKDSQNNYLLSDLGSAASPTLRGVRTIEQNDIGDGKAFLGDFSYYYIADREGIQVDTSNEATVASQSAFERNLTHVRVEERVDGELTLTQAIVEFSSLGSAF